MYTHTDQKRQGAMPSPQKNNDLMLSEDTLASRFHCICRIHPGRKLWTNSQTWTVSSPSLGHQEVPQKLPDPEKLQMEGQCAYVNTSGLRLAKIPKRKVAQAHTSSPCLSPGPEMKPLLPLDKFCSKGKWQTQLSSTQPLPTRHGANEAALKRSGLILPKDH
jgi:hypothetical protein